MQNIVETKGLLDKMTNEIKTTLEQIETREKYMNSSFDYLVIQEYF